MNVLLLYMYRNYNYMIDKHASVGTHGDPKGKERERVIGSAV